MKSPRFIYIVVCLYFFLLVLVDLILAIWRKMPVNENGLLAAFPHGLTAFGDDRWGEVCSGVVAFSGVDI